MMPRFDAFIAPMTWLGFRPSVTAHLLAGGLDRNRFPYLLHLSPQGMALNCEAAISRELPQPLSNTNFHSKSPKRPISLE
jgi:hypothetical protein